MTYEYRKTRCLSNIKRQFCKTKDFVLQNLRFMQDKRVCFARMQDKGFCFAKFAFYARQACLFCMNARQKILFCKISILCKTNEFDVHACKAGMDLLPVCSRENAVEGGTPYQVNNLQSILTKNRTQNARSTRLMQKRRFMAANSFLSSGAASRRMPMTSWRAGLGAVQ